MGTNRHDVYSGGYVNINPDKPENADFPLSFSLPSTPRRRSLSSWKLRFAKTLFRVDAFENAVSVLWYEPTRRCVSSHLTRSTRNKRDGGRCCTAVVVLIQFDSFVKRSSLCTTFRLHCELNAWRTWRAPKLLTLQAFSDVSPFTSNFLKSVRKRQCRRRAC